LLLFLATETAKMGYIETLVATNVTKDIYQEE
jgi:hypothetical protein